ncbi:ECF transporter S component [Halobacillus salinarum]|uniref:ECF transporter S component n=1 Tax=Halobacillus salinarum TaxID=2932257 RepID=A0ABY4EF64_9BACI|nr:ECF transporter S component [Halobacillus salinarum]UOQ42620.1 ECF transporter S component [Halobacillus salinarum]
MTRGLKLTDILITIVISLIFGIIYKVWGPLYGIVSAAGLQLEQLIYGMWFIAAPVAYLLIRKPGVALLAEVAAAHGEFIFGGEWGVATLIFGLGQGLAAEVVFAAFRYRRYDLIIVSLAAAASALVSIFIDYYYSFLGELAVWNLFILIVARIAGSIGIAGVFSYYLVASLEKTGVASLVRPAGELDYESLD